ncbi:NupC family nucleoside cotransporter [Talaromyces stipitatus ATCC 10500]|uniref:NupC family nucleoside cotransporter n=1 Tax=Talaromyces stipitatus (strain ATCC 10500 / CBS 375.48 / QM 6759 / NRRL 1006) TaxID=441959 RepID=B8MAH6_TALSN|nr:NupC family nucleoside cotransporter [Talaromyces stipitatus ATCC 10500]EED17400.1 NupC family nucleoside cotransporter [Talaromyces stipitatus ATCC 10500]
MGPRDEASAPLSTTQLEADDPHGARKGRESNPKNEDSHLPTSTPTENPSWTKNHSEGIEVVDERHTSRLWLRRIFKHGRYPLYGIVWLLFTGWWIAGLILHRHDLGWLIPFLLYLVITLRIIFLCVPITLVTVSMRWIWGRTAIPIAHSIPQRWKTSVSALLVAAVILIGAFVSPESADNTHENRAVSLAGLVLLIAILYFTSKDRKRVNWHPVIVGMLVQFIIALFVLRTKAGYDMFNFISSLATGLLGFAKDGVGFLTTSPIPASINSWFLVIALPAIIFFVSLVQVLFYVGVLQWFLGKFAVFFFWSMRVSGAEAVVAAASPFIGQGESAMLIRPFIQYLTLAELHQVMCSGYATISGSVLIAYVAMGVNPQALVSACVMSIPASLAVSKLRWPEQEETLTSGRVVIPEDDENRPTNALEAFTNGSWLGLKIAGMIGATLLCMISLVGLVNGLLTWWGRYINVDGPDLTLELILGYICYPIAFFLGVSRDNDDILLVARLIGIKLITNEFVAYNALQTDPAYANLSSRSRLIVTYGLCGFANIGSLGNQIGVFAQLAPCRTGDVSRVAISALITGAFSTFISASIAGMVIIDDSKYAT